MLITKEFVKSQIDELVAGYKRLREKNIKRRRFYVVLRMRPSHFGAEAS